MFFISDQPPGEGGRMPAGAQGPFPLGGGAAMFGTRFIPDPSITPPDAIQNLIKGERMGGGGEEGSISCGHCREPSATLRCGRCRCVKYCSVDCQRAHFDAMHKKNCKAIKKQRDVVSKLLGQRADPGSGLRAVEEMIKLGDLLVKVGYQESDTIVNGRLYYRDALGSFTLPMICYNNSYFKALSSTVEDKVLLMIVALGGDDRTLKVWCEETEIHGKDPDPSDPNWSDRVDKSPRSRYFESVSAAPIDKSDESVAEALGVNIRGLAQNDISFQVFHLFNLMRSLAEHRENVERLSALEDEVAREGEEELSKEVSSVLRAIRHFGNESYVVALRDSIPLREEDAPKLFRPDENFVVGRECLWMILQDLFFETPGVRNMLDEFLPEDADWDNSAD